MPCSRVTVTLPTERLVIPTGPSTHLTAGVPSQAPFRPGSRTVLNVYPGVRVLLEGNDAYCSSGGGLPDGKGLVWGATPTLAAVSNEAAEQAGIGSVPLDAAVLPAGAAYGAAKHSTGRK